MTTVAHIQLSDGTVMERVSITSPADADFGDNIQNVFNAGWIQVLLEAKPVWVQVPTIALIEPVAE